METAEKAQVESLDELISGLVLDVRGVTVDKAIELWIKAHESDQAEYPVYVAEGNTEHTLSPFHERLSRKSNLPRPIIVVLPDPLTELEIKEGHGGNFVCLLTTTLHGNAEETLKKMAKHFKIPLKPLRSMFAISRGHGIDGDAGFQVEIRQVPPPSDGIPSTSTFRPHRQNENSWVLLLPIRIPLNAARICYRRPCKGTSDDGDAELDRLLQTDAEKGCYVACASTMLRLATGSKVAADGLRNFVLARKAALMGEEGGSDGDSDDGGSDADAHGGGSGSGPSRGGRGGGSSALVSKKRGPRDQHFGSPSKKRKTLATPGPASVSTPPGSGTSTVLRGPDNMDELKESTLDGSFPGKEFRNMTLKEKLQHLASIAVSVHFDSESG